MRAVASTLPVLRAAGRAGRALGPIGGGALEVSIIKLGGLSLIRGLDSEFLFDFCGTV